MHPNEQINYLLTKDNSHPNRYLMLKLCFMVIVALLIANIIPTNAQAASGLRLYNYTTKKESTYTDKQIKITLNGATISKADAPGILVNGVSMVSYFDIFKTSAIAAECVYDKSTGAISISKYGVTIKMKIGSTKATVNGKAATLSVAPMKIKYTKANLIKVMVPSRFVSESLGLGYQWNSKSSTVAITKSTMQLSYNGSQPFEYNGVLGQVSVDGKRVSLGSMPSIITNNTAMLRAKKVFADSSIGANYAYDKASKKITFTKGDTVLEMTVGSTLATLNGNSIMMDTAPMIVTNTTLQYSFVMVPGGFTAGCLGYNYTWNSTGKTSMITSRKDTDTGNSSSTGSTSSPELGDSGVVTEPGTILKEWSGNEVLYHNFTQIHELTDQNTMADTPGTIYVVDRDYTNVKQNTETYVLMTSGTFGKVTSNNSGKTLTITAQNMLCTDATYQTYGIMSNFVNTITTTNNGDNSTNIEFELLPEKYYYNLSLSADKKTLLITVNTNAITHAVVGTNSTGDYLTLTGIEPLEVTVNQSTGTLTLDLPYTVNGIGEQFYELTGSRYMKSMYAFGSVQKTQLLINISDGYDYYTSENGNEFTIAFQTKGTTPQTGTSIEPQTPVILDLGKYEIIIPKPEGVTRSMITDEDDYFNKRFKVKLFGDFTQYFNINSITYSSSVITNHLVTLNSNYETEIVFQTSRLQGYEIAVDNENIYINIGNPKDIYKNIVVLDPGHGGGAQGAKYFNTLEKDINFKILYTLGKNYFNRDTSKLKVYFTRINDVDMTLSDRAAFAGTYGADLFVSLHMNASYSAEAKGTEVYYSETNNKANAAGLTSKAMASLFVNNLTNVLGTNNRGVKYEKYTVIHKNTVPAVLIELGFLSNKQDFALLSNETFQDNAARTIYETLIQIFDAYPTGR